MSEVSKYLGKIQKLSGKEFTDSFGNPIKTIKIEYDPEFQIGYKKPCLVYDIFLDEKLKAPKILRYGQHHTSYINRLGLVVISIPVRKRAERWLRFQRTKYQLKLATDMIPLDGNIVKIPEEHWCEYDQNNQRARICGKYVSQSGYGEWVWF